MKNGGECPSYDEMRQSLNLKSKSGIHRLIAALEERGFLKRLPHKARCLSVVKLPENAVCLASNKVNKVQSLYFEISCLPK